MTLYFSKWLSFSNDDSQTLTIDISNCIPDNDTGLVVVVIDNDDTNTSFGALNSQVKYYIKFVSSAHFANGELTETDVAGFFCQISSGSHGGF